MAFFRALGVVLRFADFFFAVAMVVLIHSDARINRYRFEPSGPHSAASFQRPIS
jgi:hypothetical protein